MRAVLVDDFEAAVFADDSCVTPGDERFLQDEVLIGRAANGRGISFDGKGVLAIEVEVPQGRQ